MTGGAIDELGGFHGNLLIPGSIQSPQLRATHPRRASLGIRCLVIGFDLRSCTCAPSCRRLQQPAAPASDRRVQLHSPVRFHAARLQPDVGGREEAAPRPLAHRVAAVPAGALLQNVHRVADTQR